MSNPPKISVCIPVYNTQETLPRCIDSVLAQTMTDYEIVIVDDGSPDQAGAIADRYASQHPCITVIHKQNAGLAEARRSAIEAARGEYIVHVDSDDDLTPDALQTLYAHCEEENLDLCYGTFRRIEPKRTFVSSHPCYGVMSGVSFLRYIMSPGCLCASWGCMSRREVWHKDVFPSKVLPSEDTLINIKMSKYLLRVGFYDEVVYNYHFNPQSLTSTGKLFDQRLWRSYFDEISEYLLQNQLQREVAKPLQAMEIDRLAFYVRHINRNDAWARRVINSSVEGQSLRTRTLRWLLRHDELRHFLITANRRVKRLFGKYWHSPFSA